MGLLNTRTTRSTRTSGKSSTGNTGTSSTSNKSGRATASAKSAGKRSSTATSATPATDSWLECAMRPVHVPDVKASPAKAEATPKTAPSASASATGALDEATPRHVAALLAIFLGGLGAHKRYLGHTNAFVIQLCAFVIAVLVGTTVLQSLAPVSAVCLFGLFEGLVYLSLSDEEFERAYVRGGREWL